MLDDIYNNNNQLEHALFDKGDLQFFLNASDHWNRRLKKRKIGIIRELKYYNCVQETSEIATHRQYFENLNRYISLQIWYFCLC
jgi:hypothetical protein